MHRLTLLLAFILILVSCTTPTPTPLKLPTATPALTSAYLHIIYDVIDDETGQPVTGEITIRRETLDGKAIEAERFYMGSHLEIDAPIDANVRLFVLVKAQGYQDWELGFRVNTGGKLKAPIRLKRIATPRPQG